MLAPMTFIVVLALILAVTLGLVVLLKALGAAKSQRQDLDLGTQTPCPKCKLNNPTHARFCGHCGNALK